MKALGLGFRFFGSSGFRGWVEGISGHLVCGSAVWVCRLYGISGFWGLGFEGSRAFTAASFEPASEQTDGVVRTFG